MFRGVVRGSFRLRLRQVVCTIRARKLKVREPPVSQLVSPSSAIDVSPDRGPPEAERSMLARPTLGRDGAFSEARRSNSFGGFWGDRGDVRVAWERCSVAE